MSECIKCGNFYLSEPNTDDEMCFRCEMEEKDERIADLEAKLAEKEEKIEEVKKWWAYQYNREMKNQHQEKISFAVEQLEKVKEYIKTNLMSFQKVPIIQELNNQIKQLKEGK